MLTDEELAAIRARHELKYLEADNIGIHRNITKMLADISRLLAAYDAQAERIKWFQERPQAPHTQAECEAMIYRPEGVGAGELQADWRCNPEHFDSMFAEPAVLDALVVIGGICAWPGDGVSCAAQMIEAQAKRAEKAEAEIDRLRAIIPHKGKVR